MICFFCGGPLDGELREVPDYHESMKECYAAYHIANGIARHESVSEEEVARRVAEGFAAAKRLVPIRHPEFGERHPDKAKVITVSNPDSSDAIQRYMRPQFPMGKNNDNDS